MQPATARLACVLIAVFAANLRAAEAPPVAADAKPPAVAAAAFPTFGAAFGLPVGWTEIPREKSGRIGQWISPDSKPEAIRSLIMIETGRSGGRQIEIFARGLARNFQGIVMDEPTTLGGEPALCVRAENHDDDLAPTEAVVCVRNGNVYLVMAGTTKGGSVQKEIEAIRASWKWTDLEKPSAHLSFREKPFAAFDGSVRLNAPNLMHETPADDPDTQLDLAMYNLARDAADFRATLTLATLKDAETLDVARERFMKDIQTRYKFVKDAPAWREGKGGTARHITTVVEADRPQPADTDTLHHQWALVSLGDASGKVVLIHFSHEAESAEERQAFEAAAEKIVASVEAAKPPAGDDAAGK